LLPIALPSSPAIANTFVGGSFSLSEKKYLYYSVLKLFTGFAIAAFTACKLIVAMAIIIAANADKTKPTS
jgi:hypothetical protein